MKATIDTLLQHNRNGLDAIINLEDIILKQKQRNADTTSLEASLKIEGELYELNVKAIKKLRDEVEI